MKNLTTLLSKGNLTPKERILLWVANQVSKDRDGKEILTEADQYALLRGWRPKDNDEAREYNRYNDGWSTSGYARLDAQTIYLNAEIALLRANRLVDSAAFADGEKLVERSKRMFGDLGVSEEDALEIILKNSGLEFNYVVYKYAFENLSEEIKQDLFALCPDAETESQYLDQEEVIADLFNGKNKLTKEAKEKLAEAMVDSPYREYAAWWQVSEEIRAWMDLRYIEGFYGSIPNVEIAKKWAEYNKIEYEYEVDDQELEKSEQVQVRAKDAGQLIVGDKSSDKEFRKDQLRKTGLTKKMKECAEKQDTDMRALLKKTLLRWLDEGLFTEVYIPLCFSEDTHTCNDIDTKLPHKEVFKAWLKAKAEAKALLQNLLNAGKLALADMHHEIFGTKKMLTIITGQSLYRLEENFTFAQDFKKQIGDFTGIGTLIVFLQRHEFLKDYATLLSFAEMFRRLSKVYEVDVAYKIQGWIRSIEDDIENINRELGFIAENLELASYIKHDIVFLKETFIEGMLIDLEKVEPGEDETVRHYRDELREILGGEF